MSTHASWDFDEYTGYVTFPVPSSNKHEHERFVYICENNDPEDIKRRAKIMSFIDRFTVAMQKYAKKHKHDNKCWKLFSETDHTFYELRPNSKFRGVNKPKNVHKCSHATEHVGVDGLLRAHDRYVFLVIPESLKEFNDLYCHEIAHTLCNHVRFRVDDHHGNEPHDFPQCQKAVRRTSHHLGFGKHLKTVW